MTPPTRNAQLRWTGDGLSFEGRAGKAPPVTLDGSSEAGPSPMEALLLSLGGCMGIDIQAILDKGRVPLEGLEVDLEGVRAEDVPQRFTRIRIEVRVAGAGEENRAKVERAVQLSRDKYCSVFHSLRSDIPVEIDIQLD